MVKLEGNKIKKLGDEIIKEVKIGNDERQFIVRLPKKITDQTILNDYKKEYFAEVKLNVKNNTQIIINLKEK